MMHGQTQIKNQYVRATHDSGQGIRKVWIRFS